MKDELGAGGDLGPNPGRTGTQDVAHQMHLAALPGRVVEVLGDRLRESAMLVGDDIRHALETAFLEPAKGFIPRRKVLCVANPHAQNLAHAVTAYSRHDEHGTHHHPIVLTAFDEQRIDQHERVVGIEAAFVEGAYPCVQANAQGADRGFREARAAQLFGDRRHLPRRDALHDHFHQRQHERLLAPLVALEQVCRKAAVPRLRNEQRDRTHPRVQRARPMTVAVTLPVFIALVTFSA